MISDVPPTAPTEQVQVEQVLPSDKVIREIKRLKSEGHSLEQILAIHDGFGFSRGKDDPVRKQIEEAYSLDVAGYGN